MKKTPHQKACLKLAVVFFAIGIIASYAMVDLIYDSYNPSSSSLKIILEEGIPSHENTFKPFDPKSFNKWEKEWNYKNRFEYDPLSNTINC